MPQVVSITQSTELGTLYTPDEIRALADHAHGLGMSLHLDGARIANAVVALETDVQAMIRDTGVDLMTFGLTKDGAMYGETVVFLRPELAERAAFVRKQAGQLSSKTRYIAAQVLALLEGGLWLRNAAHANAMAARLAAAVAGVPGVRITQPVEANGVFAILPPGVAEALQERFAFYVWDEATGEVRWMCAWDTTPEDVDAFAAAVADACAVHAG
jgi:threonine aldolase